MTNSQIAKTRSTSVALPGWITLLMASLEADIRTLNTNFEERPETVRGAWLVLSGRIELIEKTIEAAHVLGDRIYEDFGSFYEIADEAYNIADFYTYMSGVTTEARALIRPAAIVADIGGPVPPLAARHSRGVRTDTGSPVFDATGDALRGWWTARTLIEVTANLLGSPGIAEALEVAAFALNAVRRRAGWTMSEVTANGRPDLTFPGSSERIAPKGW